MGYEIKMMVGKSCLRGKEFEKDLTRPFADGSGHHMKEVDGKPVETGRHREWFCIYAEIDLCKLGYQEDALNALIEKSHDKSRSKSEVFYFYDKDGNTEYTEDRYGCPMFPVPIKDVLEATKEAFKASEGYRRLAWAVGLLESMKDDPEELSVMFWGH